MVMVDVAAKVAWWWLVGCRVNKGRGWLSDHIAELIALTARRASRAPF